MSILEKEVERLHVQEAASALIWTLCERIWILATTRVTTTIVLNLVIQTYLVANKRQLGERKSENVIKELGDDEDGDNGLFNNPKNSKENKILSYLKEILMDDDTFLEEGNLENLIYLADLIKHSAKSNAHHVLTKKDILEELADKLQSEGVIIPKLAIPTEVPVKD